MWRWQFYGWNERARSNEGEKKREERQVERFRERVREREREKKWRKRGDKRQGEWELDRENIKEREVV